MRDDAFGLFWEDAPPVRSASTYQGPLPPTPQTDWTLPTQFPDLSGQGLIAVDTETYDPELLTRGPGAQRDGYIAGISVGTEAGFRCYYPIAHKEGPNLPREKVLEWLDGVLQIPVPKVGTNLLYDLDYLTTAGVRARGPFYDIQVAEPLLDENRLSYSLESLARKYLEEGKKDDAMATWLKRAFGTEQNIKSNIWRAPPSVVAAYAEGDVDLPLRIFAKQHAQLEALKLWDLFIMESKLIPLLLQMHQRGVRVNLDRADELYKSMEQQQNRILDKIKLVAGIGVDIWAADSIAKVFDKLELPYYRTEKTNKPSFRKEWLAQHTHPVANLISEARGFDKFKETFIKGYIQEGHVNGRIHCQFNQLRSDDGGTVSGRFSSSHPNLQNIPIRSEDGRLIRQVFIPEEGQQWYKLDWSQIEYRLVVHYAALLKLRGAMEVVKRYIIDPQTDYHAMMAQLTGLSRPQAKTLNFGLIYGQGLWLLCHNLGVEVDEGQKIIDSFHKRAPFARPLYNLASRRASREGEIRTLLGRRRRFNVWEKQHYDPIKRKHVPAYFQQRVPGAKRAFTHKALNALIQGSAADIMKRAMVQSWEDGVYNVLGVPHLTVHDELDGSVDNTKAHQEALQELKHIMETCVQLQVPLRVDGGLGPDWGSTDEAQLGLVFN